MGVHYEIWNVENAPEGNDDKTLLTTISDLDVKA